MSRTIVPLFFLAALVGCVSEGSHQFGGTFTESATQDDISDFRARMEKHGASDVLVMESFPMQFSVTGLGEDCDDAREEADSLAYVQMVSACRHE